MAEMAGTVETGDRVETEDMAAPTLLTRPRSNTPSEPVDRSIAALRPAAVRSDGAAQRSSVRAPDDHATRAGRRLDDRSRPAHLRSNNRAACTPGHRAVSQYRHMVLQHRSRRLVHCSRHRFVRHCSCRFVRCRSRRHCRQYLCHWSHRTQHYCHSKPYRLHSHHQPCDPSAHAHATRRAIARSLPATLRSTVRLSIDPAWGVS